MMQTPNIKLVISGNLHRYKGVHRFLNALNEDYETEVYENEYSNFSGPEMGDPDSGPLNFTFLISSTVGKFIGTLILKEAGKWLLKDLILKPFFKKLEQFEMFNEDLEADRFVFEYDDITIIIGYSRINHVHIVSLMTMEVVRHLPVIRSEKVGEVNLISTPVIKQGIDWHFTSPPRSMPFSYFFNYWGLEFNHHNRVIYHVNTKTPTYLQWVD